VKTRTGRDGATWEQRLPHPLLAAERAAWREFRMLAEQLGLSPVARARLGLAGVRHQPADLDDVPAVPVRLAGVGHGRHLTCAVPGLTGSRGECGSVERLRSSTKGGRSCFAGF
jgi:hypothetical protein